MKGTILFKRVNYNSYTNKCDLWEVVDGKTYHRELSG